jgi:hypothetical protein
MGTTEQPDKRPNRIVRIFMAVVVVLAAAAPIAALVFLVLYLLHIRPLG